MPPQLTQLHKAVLWQDNLAIEITMEWRLADAKNGFSELVARALAEGPQRVRRHDDAVVVVAERDYEKLTGKRPEFKVGEGPNFDRLNLTRDDSPMRDVKL